MKDYSLTQKQEAVFDQLKKAFDECEKHSVFLFGDDGKICAVNGEQVEAVNHAPSVGDRLNRSRVSKFDTKFSSVYINEGLYVKRKNNNKFNVKLT